MRNNLMSSRAVVLEDVVLSSSRGLDELLRQGLSRVTTISIKQDQV